MWGPIFYLFFIIVMQKDFGAKKLQHQKYFYLLGPKKIGTQHLFRAKIISQRKKYWGIVIKDKKFDRIKEMKFD